MFERLSGKEPVGLIRAAVGGVRPTINLWLESHEAVLNILECALDIGS
jgi:hypothetical protein